MTYKKTKESGFVALFTVLLVSVILAMAIGIASISLKEIVLSSSASDGSKAFYAADSGVECALYYDRVNAGVGNFFGSGSNFTCNGNTPQGDLSVTTDSESQEVYNFKISFGENDELCANIVLKRQVYIPGQFFTTMIESKGSNVPCDDDTNPKKVERSIRVTY